MVKVALLIGVGNYEHPDHIKPLVSAPQDVAAMQRILLNPQMGDFSEVIPLIDPDPMQMQEAIETLYRDRGKDDLVLLFFSGHGLKDDGGKLYFSTRLTRKTLKGDLVKSTAVPASFVREIMGNSRSQRQVMILDCCFSGAFDPSLNAKDDGSLDVQDQLGAEGRVVLTSSSSTQYSFEQQGSELSIYTRFLVEGIETGAADRDSDGKVSVRELHEYATQKVHEAAPKMNPKIIVLKDEGFDVVFAKAQITDPKLRYRKEAERYSMRGEISPAGRTLLNTLRGRLALTLEEAQEIEDQVLQPFRERLQHLETYRSAFVAEVALQYPLVKETLNELKDLQEVLGLREEDVAQVQQEVTAQISSHSESHQKLQRYKQEFTKAIQVEFPLSQPACERLDEFQTDLGLTNEKVIQIKQSITERRAAEYEQQQLEQQRRQQDADNQRQQQEAEHVDNTESRQQQEVEQRQKLEKNQSFRRSMNRLLILVGIIAINVAAGIVFLIPPKLNNTVKSSIVTSPIDQQNSAVNAQNLLQQAKLEAEKSGNLQEAINIAAKVPLDSSDNAEAQQLISQWGRDWKKYNENFKQIEQADREGNWQKVVDIAYDPKQIPRNPYWDQKANNIAIYANNKLKSLPALFICQCAQDSSNNPNAKGLGDPFVSEKNRQKEPCNTDTRSSGFMHCHIPAMESDSSQDAYTIQSSDGVASVRKLPTVKSDKVTPDQKSGTVVNCGGIVQGDVAPSGTDKAGNNKWRYCKKLGGFIYAPLLTPI